ncbi:alpha/beta fold hydrolase [Mycetocola zhujimingii]|uniref:Alpha/beta hydrolase n=1 Tax=Mycetocola zhujimingii TaxID=2079792 RepID=A0A2U1TEV8_9MICO|nr:alpha/beta hydrolase [Mycetocola zhujimingii]PWC07350.1 alpha/beta hydrolase [Mycetocola zhujimingii]
METRTRGVLISYAEHGDGIPLVALHGAGVDHRDIEAALEAVVPMTGYRRIYPDLPGMGRSTAEGLTSNSDVVALLVDFIDQISDGPVLLAGHSYGAYLARGVAAARPERVRGLALLCPFGDGAQNLPEHRAVQQDADAYEDLEPEHRDGFDGYFVVRTRATARRYRDHVAPGTAIVDDTALERIFARWNIEDGTEPFHAPTLIVAGRQDATAGYLHATDLMERYPQATLAVIDGVGHALMHESPHLLGALLDDWLNRASHRGD